MTEDEMRAALVEATPHADWCHEVDRHPDFPCACNLDRINTADALLPTVRRIVAAELRAAADELHRPMPELDWDDWLHEHADPLDGTT